MLRRRLLASIFEYISIGFAIRCVKGLSSLSAFFEFFEPLNFSQFMRTHHGQVANSVSRCNRRQQFDIQGLNFSISSATAATDTACRGIVNLRPATRNHASLPRAVMGYLACRTMPANGFAALAAA